VPVQLAQGWGGVAAGGALLGALAAPAAAPDYVDKTMDRTIDRLRDSPDREPSMESSKWSRSGFFGRRLRSTFDKHAPAAAHVAAPRPAPAPAPPGPLHVVLGAQSAEGWFEWNEELEQLLIGEKKTRDACRPPIEEALAAFDVRPDGSADVTRVVATVLALWLLRHRFGADARLWDRAAAKARRWVAAETGRHAYDVNPWLERIDAHLPTT